MNPASRNLSQRPAKPGFSWGGAVAALSFAFVLCLGSPAFAAQVDDVDFCLSVGKWGPYGPNGPGPGYLLPDTVARIDLASWKLVTETGGVRPIAFEPDPQPWRPVVGDWDGDGLDAILMFNVHDWRLVPAERGPISTTEGSGDPSPTPWVPVAGDFDGDGRDSVLVYDLRDGSLHRPEAGPPVVERYVPAAETPVILAGDWDGDRIDSIAVIRGVGDPFGPDPEPWSAVAGDFDADGIDTVALFHGPTGELAIPEVEAAQSLSSAVSKSSKPQAAFASVLQLPNGCYTTVKNKVTYSVTLPDGQGGVETVEHSSWEQWFCCPLETGGRYSCSVKLVTK